MEGAGVNGPDLMQRRGLYPAPKGASELLGLEIAGEVVAIGENVTRWAIGYCLCRLANGGGYAEFCLLDADHCLPMPEGLSCIEAASLPEAYFTIWSKIFMAAGLSEGETLLVQGGAGGLVRPLSNSVRPLAQQSWPRIARPRGARSAMISARTV